MESITTRRGGPVQPTYTYCPAPAANFQGVPTFPAGEEHYSHNYPHDGHADLHGQHGGHSRQDSAHTQQSFQSALCYAPNFQNTSAIPTGEQLFGHDQSYLDGYVDTPTRRRNGHSRHPSHMTVESPRAQQPAFQFAEEPHDLPTLPTTKNHHGQSFHKGHEHTHGQNGGHSRHLSLMDHASQESFVSAFRQDMVVDPTAERDQIVPNEHEKEHGQHDGHTRHLSLLTAKPARAHQKGQGSLSAFKYAQIPDMPIPVFEKEASQGFPFVDRPSNESIVIGAIPNVLDPVEHNVCIGLIQESQAGLESLKFQVEVGKHDAEISHDKIESLETEIARLRTKSVVSFSDKQDFRDRIDALMAEVRYLSTLPHNEKYLDKIKLFEDEARVYRQTKFRSEQAHAKEIEALENEKSSLESKLKATEIAYGSEMDRLAASLNRERASKELALRSLKLNEVKMKNLEKSLERERAHTSQVQDELNELREWKKDAARKDSERIYSVIALFQSVNTTVRHTNEQMEVVGRALQNLL